MSGDEIFALVVCLLVTLFTVGSWIHVTVKIRQVRPSLGDSWIWFGAAAGILLLFIVLRWWASWDVRESVIYLIFYLVMGLAAVAVALLFLDRLGLSLRDDAIERANPAARLTLAGVIAGFFAAYAGANIGDGPGWWVVVFCAVLSMGSLLLGWVLLDRGTHAGEAIVVGRDVPTALRMAVWFMGLGALQGRAVAGNWEGAGPAIVDYLEHSKAGGVLLLTGVIVEKIFGSGAGRSAPLIVRTYGPAGLYLCFVVLTLLRVHPW